MSIRWPRVLTPTHLAQIIKTQRNPLTALQIFNQAQQKCPDYRHNGPVYATMIDILGRSSRLSEMKQVIGQMKEDSCECKDSTFAGAIRTFASAGMVNEAVNLFNRIPQFNRVNFTQSFNTLLGIMMQESDFKAAYQPFSEYSWRLEVKSRVKSLNLLMEGLCQLKKSDLALNIFQEMDFQGCYLDRESYRILMKGLCDDGKFNEATHLLYSMFWRISQKGSGEYIVIYRILLNALYDNGKVEEALELLAKILRKGLKASKSCRHQIDLSQGGNGEDSEATKRLINEALIRGAVPSMAGYNAMAIDLYNEGRVDGAETVFDEMRKKGFWPSLLMYEAKAEALSKKGRVSEAVKVIEEDIKEGTCVPSVKLYNIVLKCHCDAGDSELAVGYLKKMAKQVGCVADRQTYSILVDGLRKDGKFVEASRVGEQMVMKRHWPDAEIYNILIRGFSSVRGQYDAFIWLEEMVRQGMVPDFSLWNSLVASHYIQYDQYDHVIRRRDIDFIFEAILTM